MIWERKISQVPEGLKYKENYDKCLKGDTINEVL